MYFKYIIHLQGIILKPFAFLCIRLDLFGVYVDYEKKKELINQGF